VHFVTRFLGGLKEEIGYIIVLHRPKEMDTASASASALSFILTRRGLAGVPLARPSLLIRRMTQKISNKNSVENKLAAHEAYTKGLFVSTSAARLSGKRENSPPNAPRPTRVGRPPATRNAKS